MRFAAEVRIFHQQVGGKQQIPGCAARAVNSAIVADAQLDPGSWRQRHSGPNPLGELPFGAGRWITLDHINAYLREYLTQFDIQMFGRASQVLSKPRKSAFLAWKTQEHDEQNQEKVSEGKRYSEVV